MKIGQKIVALAGWNRGYEEMTVSKIGRSYVYVKENSRLKLRISEEGYMWWANPEDYKEHKRKNKIRSEFRSSINRFNSGYFSNEYNLSIEDMQLITNTLNKGIKSE